MKRFFLIFILVLIADQSTKLASEAYLLVASDGLDPTIYQGSRIPIFGVDSMQREDGSTAVSLEFNYVRNLGAAGGFLRDLPSSVRLALFHVLTILFCLGLFRVATYLKLDVRGMISTEIIIAGAISNMVDRVRLGYVIDMIDIKLKLGQQFHRPPVFNVADLCVVVGLVGLCLSALKKPHTNTNSTH
jgi:lipoprotein signal peptidase